MVKHLSESSFAENLCDVKEVSDFYRGALEHFPHYGDGHRAFLHLHQYMTLINLKVFQFQQSSDFIRAAMTLLKERVT